VVTISFRKSAPSFVGDDALTHYGNRDRPESTPKSAPWGGRRAGPVADHGEMRGRLERSPESDPEAHQSVVGDQGRCSSVESLAGVAGNAAVSRFLTVQRMGSINSAETQLGAVQGNAMYGLLPELETMAPSVVRDQAAARQVGGDRLVLATEAVTAKGEKRNWVDFAQQRSGRLAQLPADQVTDLIRYLGAPADARYYTRQQFAKNYDGAVDPAKNEITLVFKVKFFFEDSPRMNVASLRKGFPAGFKTAVEDVWSNKGTCQVPTADGGRRPFTTRVRVEVTDQDPHYTFTVSVIPPDRSSFVADDAPVGGLDYRDNTPKQHDSKFPLPDGGTTHTQTDQTTSAHEAGHAFGLAHANGTGNDSKDYADRPDQAADIMGLGNKIMVQTNPQGQVTHNDFAPFEAIADKWRAELYPGPLDAQCR
jgi:hypothetical protein